MPEKNKLVGRGLKDLIEEHSIDRVLDGETVLEVKLSDIIANPNQPRKVFNEEKINELAISIKEHGVFQPIILKKVENGYIIVSGERRFRASKIAGLSKIPAVVRNYSNEKIAEISLVENLQREDLTAIEEAIAYEGLIKQLKITQSELATRLGKSRSHITNMLGMLKLPEKVKNLLLEKKLSMGHARTLSKLKDENKMIELAERIIKEDLNVREIEDITSNIDKATVIANNRRKVKFRDERKILIKYYKSKVSIKDKKVIFTIENDEEMMRLISELMKNAL